MPVRTAAVMDLLLRGGRVIETSGSLVESDRDSRVFDGVVDVLIRDGRVAAVGPNLAAPDGVTVVDVAGMIVTAGLLDLHVHFREPGQEYKEDIGSGSAAAAAGGFTTVCCMPNTKPANDCRAVTDLIVRRSKEVGVARVLPIGAISRGLEGASLAEFGEMQEAGIVAVSDDGRPVMNAALMRRALEYAKNFGLTVVQHAEDLHLAEGGVMNEGEVSTRIGLRGQPPSAESVMVARDIELVEWTGARYHVAHISTARTVALVRDAKRRGLPVTCEVAPHHFMLTDQACASYDTSTKVMPPLRTDADIAAIKVALADGVIDCVATDHAPHSDVEKEVEFDCAAPGMLGLETAVPLTLALVRDGVIGLPRFVELFTSGPASVFGLEREGLGALAVGGVADLCVIDLARDWTVDKKGGKSKSTNTPFHGLAVTGRAVLTIFGGRVVYDLDGRLEPST